MEGGLGKWEGRLGSVARIHHMSWVGCNFPAEMEGFQIRRHKTEVTIHHTSWVANNLLVEPGDFQIRRHKTETTMVRSYPVATEDCPSLDSYRYRHHNLAETGMVESLEACMVDDSAM
jgi:hypothetical protein